MEKLVANRYAEALFGVGLELNMLDEVKESMLVASETLKNNDDYFKILKHPRVHKDEKKEMIKEAFSGHFPQEVLNLIYILIDRGRTSYIPLITEQYVELYNDEKNIIVAKAYSSIALTSEQTSSLVEKLKKELNAEVVIENIVDESLLGGIRLVYNNQVIDNTVATKLGRLKDDLYTVKL